MDPLEWCACQTLQAVPSGDSDALFSTRWVWRRPGFKDSNGNWDLRPHRARIQKDTRNPSGVAGYLGARLQSSSQTRMIYSVNHGLRKSSGATSGAQRVGRGHLEYSSGWHEKIRPVQGALRDVVGKPQWQDADSAGTACMWTPLLQDAQSHHEKHRDWTAKDFEALAPDELPVTTYKPAGSSTEYDCSYTHWGDSLDGGGTQPRGTTTGSPGDAWRRIQARGHSSRQSFRQVATHVHGVGAAGKPLCETDMVLIAGDLSSLLRDFSVRAAPKS